MKKIFLILLSSVVFLIGKVETKAQNQMKEEVVTILQTADIHAYLDSHTELFLENDHITYREAGGLASIKTLVEQVRNNNPEGTLFVDGGDLLQGSGESVLSNGRIFPPLIRAMEYDLLIPGNWEVIYGKDMMMEVMEGYDTNVIVANMFHENNNAPIFPPYWVTEKKGLKMGFIAYNDPEVPIRQNPGFSKGLKFTEIENNLQSLIKELKEEKGVEVLFLVSHIGISKQLLLADNPAIKGVDFILGNDTHERIRVPIQGKYAKVVEPGAFGSFVGRLDLKVRDGKMTGYDYQLIEVNPKKYVGDPKVQSLVNEAKQPYAHEMNRVLGYTTTPIHRYLVVESPMDNLITDALLWKSGADFATSNGFRFGVPIVPDPATGKKAITKEDLWRMLPVDEQMKIGEVTGEQIKNWLEKEINNVFAVNPADRFGGWLVRFSGMTLKFDSSKPKGERILEIKIKGAPLDLKKTYRMASCNRTGEPISTLCRMPNAKNVELKEYTLHDAVEEYLKVKGEVSPKLDGRSQAIDLGPDAYSQVPGTNYKFK